MNPRSPQLVFSALGCVYGATQFFRGLGSEAPFTDQLVWIALFAAGALLTVYFLRQSESE